MKDASIRPFYLTVGLGVGHYNPSYVDLLFIIEVDKCTSRELGAAVCNDCVHDPILVYDLLDEQAVAMGLASIHLVNLSTMTNK